MTGYAIERIDTPSGKLIVEIRGVNSRFLDLNFRIPDEVRHVEPVLRERLSSTLQRGKVECRVAINHDSRLEERQDINLDAVRALSALETQLREEIPTLSALSMRDVLSWPGVVRRPEVSADQWSEWITQAFEQALEGFQTSRHREGSRLAEIILARLTDMQGITDQCRVHLPRALEAQRKRLSDRMAQALEEVQASVDAQQIQDRLRQEIVLYGIKTDVDEEISRLGIHFREIENIIGRGGSVGKRLDFLMQELNREANTLGSKSPTPEISEASVNLKLLIEQVREQVQNLE